MAKQNAIGVPASVDVGGTGSISFTAGSIVFSNGSILTQDNSNLFWDDTNNRLGIGITTPLDTLHVSGAFELDHTAVENDDHALEIVCDAAGFSDVKALDIDYISGAVAAGEDEEAILVNIDESASTGGIIAGYLVLSTSEGSATINGYETGININPVVHESGTFGDADNILNKVADVTAALASGGAGTISIFVADNDTFTIGDAATWDEMEIILGTGASGAGVAPTFEYSTGGAGYSAFGPADGTNGFRNTGAILWDSSTLAGWATATSGDFEIRITRTRNTVSTTPIIDELQISATTEYKWDKDGAVNFASLTMTTPLAEASGGTGQSTYTQGDTLYASAANTLSKLAVGSASNVLTSDGTDVAWGAAPTAPNSVVNLGMAYDGGTGVFTIQGSSAALSATNPALVTIQSNTTPGLFVTVPVIANQSFIDDVGSSEILNNLFGFTTSVAITVDIPFFVYAVLNDDEDGIQFMISREAGRTISPAAAGIGAPDDAVADDQEDFWSFDSITETEWASNPCLMVGSFRMVMSASDDWTVQTLSAGSDGIGNYQNNVTFTMPLGQMGADASSLTIANGGTSPVFTTIAGKYRLTQDGFCYYQVLLGGDGGTDGSGAVTALCSAPFKNINETTVFTMAMARVQTAGGAIVAAVLNNNGANASFRLALTGSALTYVQWGAFTNGLRRFEFQIYYNYLG